MLTTRSAASLLASTDTDDGLLRLAREIGFHGSAAPLDKEARRALGIPDEAVTASVIQGAGSLRALAFSVPVGTEIRPLLRKLATTLASRAPHVLWTLLLREEGGHALAITAASLERRPPRMAALLLSRARVMESDIQTLRLLGTAATADDLATHARYIDILGRETVSRRFFRELERLVGDIAASASAGSTDSRWDISLLYSSRLLFLAFVEAKGWLDGDVGFLSRTFDEAMVSGGDFHRRVLLPLFFGTLNTPPRRRAARARAFGRIPFLNGGLFTPTRLERRLKSLVFDDAALGAFFGDLLGRYRFTSLETSSIEEAAIDPEMLGRTFECLMARSSRRASGAFYTPQELVARVADRGLEEVLTARLGASVATATLRGEELPRGSRTAATEVMRGLRILDPACGSGAFLVHTLDRVSSMLATTGDDRPAQSIRREVLARSIFGVDVNPTAVWLCQLRLWLSVVMDANDDGGAFPPLPNLDRNVRVGDSLAGPAFEHGSTVGAAQLRQLRERYARASGGRKASLARTLDRQERRLLLGALDIELSGIGMARRELISVRRGRDLFGERHAVRDHEASAAELRARAAEIRTRRRSIENGGALPFSFAAHFGDVAASGGFDLVVGNPPWVRPHRIEARDRAEFRSRFSVARSATWLPGAEAAGAGRGFASQVDLAALFTERGVQLLTPGGALAFLVPTKLWRSLSGGGLRRFLTTQTRVAALEDYADMPGAFDAAVYPGLIVASKGAGPGKDLVRVSTLHRGRTQASWIDRMDAIPLDDSAGAPWLLVPDAVRRAFDSLRDVATPLAESQLGRPLLGVKCGFNDAFIVAAEESNNGLTHIVAANGRDGLVERAHLRPVTRGEDIRRWRLDLSVQSIVWPCDQSGAVLRTLPPGLQRWLAPSRTVLKARSDCHSSRWWELFRTDGARNDRPRVVWADIGLSPRAAVLDRGDARVPINTCYVVRCADDDDAWALAALLNSRVIAAWLSIVAEPARGGYRRYLGWTMSLLPVPKRWNEYRNALAAAGRRQGDCDALDAAVLEAFGLRPSRVEALLTWSAP